ncbi:MAG: Peptidoglycan O-acetyltransferase [Firmicutes bacterium]|nr:Peptidoglycan O-acetyltransferase [Bacillota bacterium]
MLFHTPEFALLLLVTAMGFALTSGDARLWVLLGASLVFYSFSGPFDTMLFAGVLGVVYFMSLRLAKEKSLPILMFTLIVMFGNLALFKYGDFFLLRRPTLWLPLGISFYTFQMAAYVIDIYRGTILPERKFVTFAVFITFFGQLVAGPIMRAQDFLPQLRRRLAPLYEDVRAGAFLIGRGLIKKVLIADRLAGLVDERFYQGATLSHAATWVALYFFAFQVYFDFSGYTDMGIGLGRLFGLKLSPNFTLSTWLRDYLYIPLGGNRCTPFRRNLNLFITMLLGGLWHGAAWTFVLWGAFQGVWLVIYRMWGGLMSRRHQTLELPHAVNVFLTFHVQCLSYVFFRSMTMETALAMWWQALDFSQLASWEAQLPYLPIVGLFFAMHVGERYLDERHQALLLRWQQVPAPLRGLAYAVAVFVLILSFRPAEPFIYFRF